MRAFSTYSAPAGTGGGRLRLISDSLYASGDASLRHDTEPSLRDPESQTVGLIGFCLMLVPAARDVLEVSAADLGELSWLRGALVQGGRPGRPLC